MKHLIPSSAAGRTRMVRREVSFCTAHWGSEGSSIPGTGDKDEKAALI